MNIIGVRVDPHHETAAVYVRDLIVSTRTQDVSVTRLLCEHMPWGLDIRAEGHPICANGELDPTPIIVETNESQISEGDRHLVSTVLDENGFHS